MKKLFKDYFSVIFGTGFSRGISFVTMLMLVRVLTVEGFGKFSMFFTVMMLVWQLPGSIDAVYVRYAKAGAEAERFAYLRTAFIMKVWAFVFVCAASYPFGWFLSVHVFCKPELTGLVSMAIFSGGFLSVFSTLSGMYQAQEKFLIYSIINSVFYSLVFFSVGWFFVKKIILTPFDAALMFSIVAVVVGMGAALYLSREMKLLVAVSRVHFRNMFNFGKWLFAETLLYVVLQRLDILFLARFADYHQIAVYSAAVRIAMVASIMTSAATAIFMPRGCASLRSPQHLRTYFRDAAVVTTGLTAMIIALIAAVPALIGHLFGADYAQGMTAARILLIEAVFILLYTPFSFIFYASGKTQRIFAVGVIRMSVMIAGLSVMVPRFGSTGAALAIAASTFTGLIFAVVMSMKILMSAHHGREHSRGKAGQGQ
ncbi:MAG TPA: oligosaccharide flippase family protein [Candidatus Omnitrophota bacterium]|nr:oligosaccharide flippase family protein [Candidatus Omnitrophota bacterium]HQQ06729.1 oligosaccharide flippase family protein [Candidatus Omnitrophota bacterium]